MPALLTPKDYVAAPSVPADRRIAYGPAPDQFGDLYRPSSSPPAQGHPVIALLHGGCWRQQFGNSHLGQIARLLAGQGFAVWNIEYRRLDGEGGWPATFQDAAAALDFLRELAHEESIDLQRVVAAGHSAGGHLALWLAGRKQLPVTSELYQGSPMPLRGVASLAGIGDLAHAVETDICRGAPELLMGGLVETHPDRYAQGSPHALLPLRVRQFHAVGSEDQLVPKAHVKRFTELATASGDNVRLEVVAGAGHFELVTPGTTAWEAVHAGILSLF